MAIRAEVLACLGDPIGLDPITSPAAPRAVDRLPPKANPLRAILPDQGLVASIDERPKHRGNGSDWAIALTRKDGTLLGRRSSPVHQLNVLRFSPDGTKLAAGGEQGFAVFTVPDLLPWAIFRGDSVYSLDVHPRGRLMASLNNNQKVELWDLETNRLVASFPVPAKHGRVEFAADGKSLLAVAGDGTRLIAWPIGDTPERLALDGHRGGVPGLAFSPDGRRLASVSKDRTVRFWDVETGRALSTWTGDEGEFQALAFSPDGTLLATADWQGSVRIWQVASGQTLLRMQVSRQIWQLRFDPRERFLVALSHDRLDVWEFRRTSDSVALEPLVSHPIPGSIGLALHPSRLEMVFSERTGRVHRYDLERDRFEAIPGMSAAMNPQSLVFDGGGAELRFIDRDGVIERRDWTTGASLGKTRFAGQATGIKYSPDGRFVAVQVGSGRIIIHDLATGLELVALPAESSPAWWWEWSPDGTRLAVALADGRIALWDLEQVRSRLAEFRIAVPSTAGRAPAPPPSESPPAGDFDRLLERRRRVPQSDGAGSDRPNVSR